MGAVLVPIGVGALAAAVARHYRATNSDALLVGVEPVDAACVMELYSRRQACHACR